MGIGQTLSELLQKNNMNVSELSELSGVSASTIYSMIKRDSMKADITSLGRICRVLGVSMDYFYSEYIEEKDFSILPDERVLLKQYRTLDNHGKGLVDMVLNYEYNRCMSEPSEKIKFAALNGNFEEKTMTNSEQDELLAKYDAMPDVDDL